MNKREEETGSTPLDHLEEQLVGEVDDKENVVPDLDWDEALQII